MLVKEHCKLFQILRRLGELDEPLMAALRIGIHKHWGGRVFQHFGSCLITSVCQSLLGIVHNQLLTKGIDEVLGATRDDKLIRVCRGELYRVAYLIAPKSARGRDDHRIVLALLNTPEGHRVASVHRNELIEHPIVEHQQHRLVRRIVLNAEESLAGVIGLHIVHPWRGNQLLILLAVGREGHSAVKEHLDIRPHLFQMRLARHLHHTGQHGEHP